MAQFHVIAVVTIDEFVYNVDSHGPAPTLANTSASSYGISLETDSIIADRIAMISFILHTLYHRRMTNEFNEFDRKATVSGKYIIN